ALLLLRALLLALLGSLLGSFLLGHSTSSVKSWRRSFAGSIAPCDCCVAARATKPTWLTSRNVRSLRRHLPWQQSCCRARQIDAAGFQLLPEKQTLRSSHRCR